MKINIGFSPCPNDTFIFDALVNKKIDTLGLSFHPHLEDVQTLNQWAMEGRLEASKISYGVLPLVLKNYIVLSSGGALGKGVGPLFITTANRAHTIVDNLKDITVAIPGEHTTAHILFTLAYPQVNKKRFMLFSEIEQAVLANDVDAGVIIHENRFTYMDKGLVKLADLGAYWEKETGAPIPLGGIIAQRSLDAKLIQTIDELIRRSVEYAFANYPVITEYVKMHSQEMQESVMRQHIDLYVNQFSIDLKNEGRSAVEKFLDVYRSLHGVIPTTDQVFAESKLTV